MTDSLRTRRSWQVAIWLLVAGVLLGAAAAAWLAGEVHYRNCLTHAQMASRALGGNEYEVPGRTCSRWPF